MENLTRQICALAPLPAEPSDRIELIPVGEFRLADKRGRQAMRLDNVAAVIAASFEVAAGGVLPIDFDHRSFAPQGSADSRAAGWITAMEAEGDRVIASVEWTAEGRRALKGRAYRFLSPVFKTRPNGEVALIEGAGLVNNPSLPALRQLASKEEDTMDPIKKIAELLGLSVDEPEKIVARIGALLKSETQMASIAQAAGVSVEGDDLATQICAKFGGGDVDPSKYVPMSAFTDLQSQFASLRSDLNSGKAETALQKARDDGKLTPAMEDWATQLASKDLAQFEAWAAAAPALVNLGGQRLSGKVPPVKTDALDETERQVASMMGVSEASFLATRNAAVKEG